jgi:hypothetical protein
MGIVRSEFLSRLPSVYKSFENIHDTSENSRTGSAIGKGLVGCIKKDPNRQLALIPMSALCDFRSSLNN